MSAAHRPKGRRIYDVKVPTESGAWRNRTTKTRDRVTARAMQAMVDALGGAGKGAWDILGRVTSSPPTLTVPELWRRWNATPIRHDPDTGDPIEPSVDERIKHVRASFIEGDLKEYVEPWYKVLIGPKEDVGDDTAKHYVNAVRRFLVHAAELEDLKALAEHKGEIPLAVLTETRIITWLEEMDDVEPATVRKRGIGLHRFIRWLRSRRHLAFDPMVEIKLPAQAAPLTHYLDTPDVVRLGDTAAGQQRLLEYLLPGSAMELSTALGIRARVVSKDDREIHAPGTKTHNRNRVVRVADFAWDAVLELLKGKHPDSRLFDRIQDRWVAREEHVLVIDTLIAKDHEVYGRAPDGTEHKYTLRDHRHTWAVRAARSGTPIGAIAEQLGHGDGGALALKVYGRFLAKKDERARWEAMATARDEARAKEEQR